LDVRLSGSANVLAGCAEPPYAAPELLRWASSEEPAGDEAVSIEYHPEGKGLKPTRRAQAFALLVTMGSVEGCEAPFEPPPVVWEGEHVHIATELDLNEWCAGSLSRLDAYTGAVKDLLEAPSDYTVTYALLDPPVSDPGPCPKQARACVFDDLVLTADLPDDHEVVHAVTSAHDSLPTVFEEGGASYWGGIRRRPDLRGLDLREVLEAWNSRYLTPGEYALMAHFTSYLVHTQGRERYAGLLRESHRAQGRSSFESTFERTFGLSLEDALEDYDLSWPYCRVEATQSSFFACAEPALTLVGGHPVEIDFDISCGHPQVVGPGVDRDGTLKIWQDVAIELEDPKYLQVVELLEPYDPPEGLSISVKRCDTDCANVEMFSNDLVPSTFSEDLYGVGDERLALRGWRFTGQASGRPSQAWEPGRYAVRVSRDADDPGRVRIRWRP
jgi:hypothetical protein